MTTAAGRASRGAVVAVVGRANVGKSTLVNRIAGKRLAIEHEQSGVTRDRQGYEVSWGGVSFTVVDTGGWEPRVRVRGLGAKVRAQAERAAREADLILLTLDATTGITGDDLAVARSLRRSRVPVVVVANKVDNASVEAEAAALVRLGFGEPVPVSALHGRGAGDLLEVVADRLRDVGTREAEVEEPALRVAIVGRPNVGKSSLLNRLAGDERAIVDEAPGTTRDTVDTVVDMAGRRVRFVDTAGMRRKAKQASGPEYYGLVRSLRAIGEADVVLHVVDASVGPTEQDQKIARRIVEAGRAAVLLLNKWDLVPPASAQEVARLARDRLAFVSWAPLVRVSARTGRGIARIAAAVERARESWELRVPTAALNAWLREAVDRVPLGSRGAKPPRIRYVTQAGVRPPQVVLFSTGEVSETALRALERRLRERFGFEGTPLRLVVRRRAPSPDRLGRRAPG